MQHGSDPPMYAITQPERPDPRPVDLAPMLAVHDSQAVRASSHAAGDK
jgi:hypothetical protein